MEQETKPITKIQLDWLKKQKPFFATPCYGGQIFESYLRGMIRLVHMLSVNQVQYLHSTIANESLVTRARNNLVAYFLSTDCTHLFFIDADIEFDPSSVISMLIKDEDVVLGAYPKKGINWTSIEKAVKGNIPLEKLEKFQAEYVLNFKFESEERRKAGKLTLNNGLIELLDGGTGFMCIKRSVIEKMINAYPETKYVNDINLGAEYENNCYSLFDTMHCPDSNRYLSEDYTFCRRWQSLKGKIWLDPTVNLNHKGTHNFLGNISSILKSDDKVK
tara:strand:- start:3122 stop:3946 length:825 start_codon:yes stop_codon:yes gene_type:complete